MGAATIAVAAAATVISLAILVVLCTYEGGFLELLHWWVGRKGTGWLPA